MEVRADAPAKFSGAPLTLFPAPATDADQAYLVAYDAQNREVTRSQIPITGEAVSWAGTDALGGPLAAGVYSFRLESYKTGEFIGETGVEVYGRVNEIRNGSDGAVLVLDGGAELAPSAVNALRSAASP
jgi:flagellar basal-body rod modification protein FlgD